MSKKGAGYRLRKELLAINKDRPEFIWATHKETYFTMELLVAPPDDTVYGGGYYWGSVPFPQDYPFAPPGIQFAHAVRTVPPGDEDLHVDERLPSGVPPGIPPGVCECDSWPSHHFERVLHARRPVVHVV